MRKIAKPEGIKKARTRRRFCVKAVFLDLRPAHANYFVGFSEAGSISAGIGRAMRDIMKKLRQAREAKKVRGRIQTVKLIISISKVEGSALSATQTNAE